MAKIPAYAIERASAEVYRRWRNHVSEAEARAEAERFVQRCRSLADQDALTEPELDAALDIVTEAMSAA